jgi:hypothetical protein
MNKNFVFRGKVSASDYIFLRGGGKFLGGDVGNSLRSLATQQYHSLNYIYYQRDYTAIFDNAAATPVNIQDPPIGKSFNKIIVNKTGGPIYINFSNTVQTQISFTDAVYNGVLSSSNGSPVQNISLLDDRAIELTWTGTEWVLK